MGESVIIVPVLMFTFYSLVKLISNHKLKSRLIDKGIGSEELKDYLVNEKLEIPSFNWTKVALVIITLGVINLTVNIFYLGESEFALYCIGIGVILLVSSKIEKTIK